MNVRVDLILPSERRSGNRVTLALCLRIACVVVPLLVIAAGASALYQYNRLQKQLAVAKEELKSIEPEYKEAMRLADELARQGSVTNEIAGWRKARISWGPQLKALQLDVPAQIQLTELRVESAMQTVSNKAARMFKMQIKGKTGGMNAETHVIRFEADLARTPVFSNVTDAVEIPPGSFAQDTALTASKLDRVFEIDCKYKPARFE